MSTEITVTRHVYGFMDYDGRWYQVDLSPKGGDTNMAAGSKPGKIGNNSKPGAKIVGKPSPTTGRSGAKPK